MLMHVRANVIFHVKVNGISFNFFCFSHNERNILGVQHVFESLCLERMFT